MVDSWITLFPGLFEIENYQFINRNPHSFNNSLSCLDHSFATFSTHVQEKSVRKTNLRSLCQPGWNKWGIVHRRSPAIRSK